MLFNRILAVAAFAASGIYASPVQEPDDRNLPPEQCSKVAIIVKVLRIKKAAPFCSSFLSIKPATSTSIVQVTSTTVVTATSTITSGVTSTSIVFKPGNPPAKVRRGFMAAEPIVEGRGAAPLALEGRDSTPTVPSFLKAYATAEISTCAAPIFPTRDPTIPFGDSNDAGVGDIQSNLNRDTTIEDCCNLCYFGVPNCIQGIYYSYQGCVILQAVAPNGTGDGVSSICPNGKISGLMYNPDLKPDFRSQGNIAGPCGEVYNNL